MITNVKALLAEIVPFGISLFLEVLLFALSISLSIYLLNAIAADRAKIINKTTYINIVQSIFFRGADKKNPMRAKGNAKMV